MEQNKHIQLETGYVSETEMNVLTRELLLLSCSKEIRERGLLNSNLEQKSNKNPRAKFERVLRGSEWMRVECESSKLTPRPLFKGIMAGHGRRRPASTASDRWRRMGPLAVGKGPVDPRVRPNPRWPTLLTARAHCSSNGHMLFKLWCWPNFASKRFSNKYFFQRISMLRKYFFGFFYKKKKKC